MAVVQFDRDSKAKWYAYQHLKVDPGARTVYYLPADAPDREIRLLEVNTLIADMTDESLEPLDYGVDVGAEEEHKLLVLDVTPRQWEAISRGEIPLPKGWALEGAIAFNRRRGQ